MLLDLVTFEMYWPNKLMSGPVLATQLFATSYKETTWPDN